MFINTMRWIGVLSLFIFNYAFAKIDFKQESYFSDLSNLDFNVDVEKIILGKNKFLKPLISFKKKSIYAERRRHRIKCISS